MDGNNEAVPQIYVDLRTWPLTVDTNDRPCKTIRASSNPIDAPFVLDCFGKRHLTKAK